MDSRPSLLLKASKIRKNMRATGISLAIQWFTTLYFQYRTQVQALVSELRSHMPPSATKK